MLIWMRRGLRLGLLLLFFLSAGLLWIRVAPPSLGFLGPAVERALARTLPGTDSRIEGIRLDWPLGSLDPAIRIDRVQVRSQDGSILAASPDIGLNLRLSSLVRGEIDPFRIILHRPILDLTRLDGNGSFSDTVSRDTGGAEKISEEIALFLQEGLSRLRSGIGRYGGQCLLTLKDAVLLFGEGTDNVAVRIDTGTIESSEEDVRVSLQGRVEWVSGETRFKGQLSLPERGEVHAEIDFIRLMPKALGSILPPLSDFQGADLPLSGRIRLSFDTEDRFAGAAFHFSGSGGTINHIFLDTPIAIQTLKAAGQLGSDLSTITIDSFFADTGTVKLAAAGTVGWKNGPLDTDLKANITGITFQLLPDLWPSGLARKFREWFLTHFQGGIAETVDLRLQLTPEDFKREHPRAEALGAVVDFSEVILDYQPPLPRLRNGAGQAIFDADSVKIRIDKGVLASTRLLQGIVEITKFSAKRTPIRIEGNLEGPARDLVDLGQVFDDKENLPFSVVHGSARTRLGLRFDIWKGLEPKDVIAGIDSASEIRGATFANPLEISLENGAFSAKIAGGQITAEGEIIADRLPVQVRWERNLLLEPPLRIALSAQIPTDGLARHGIHIPFVKGLLGVEASVQMDRSRVSAAGSVDLQKAAIDLDRIGLKKPFDQDAIFRFDLLAEGPLIRFSDLDLSGTGIEVKGTATLNTDSDLLTAALYRVRFGRNDLNLDIRWHKDEESRIDLSGALFDAAPLMAWEEKEKNGPASFSGMPKFPIRLVVDLDQISLKNSRALNHAVGQLVWNGQETPVGVLEGRMDSRSRVRIDLDRADGTYHLNLHAQDAGLFLDGFGIFSNIRGGQLHAEIHPHDPLAFVPPFEGEIRMKNFTVTEAPEVINLLSLASFDGFVEQLNHRGIPFDTLDSELLYADKKVLIDWGRMEGSALGVTVKGEIDLTGKTVGLSGIIVPFNTVNQLVGSIPLVGKLITGDGIIAANYTIQGPWADPQIRVNPLSTLLVGSLRKIFRGME